MKGKSESVWNILQPESSYKKLTLDLKGCGASVQTGAARVCSGERCGVNLYIVKYS